MKQQTSMRELIDYINEFEYPVPEQILLKATELLKKEQQQIQQAYVDGIIECTNSDLIYSALEYYNRKYI